MKRLLIAALDVALLPLDAVLDVCSLIPRGLVRSDHYGPSFVQQRLYLIENDLTCVDTSCYNSHKEKL